MRNFFIDDKSIDKKIIFQPGSFRKKLDIMGDFILSFIEPVDQKLEENNLAEFFIPANKDIKSDIIYFVIEHEKISDLERKLIHRLFTFICLEELGRMFSRKGSDIYFKKTPIAASINNKVSDFSNIYFSLCVNVTSGKENITNIRLDARSFALKIMQKYIREYKSLNESSF
ncbi:MAG: DUF366 family protein [bacterium]|nr:DUF366 family protein [bacterium]